jgi:hypothetical protein
MLAAVAPLVGNRRAVGYRDRIGTTQYWSCANGNVLYDDVLALESPMPMCVDASVAVLTGPSTGSSGEGITLTFRGAPKSRSFGAPTAGVPTGNRTFPLPDGSMLVLMGAIGVDVAGDAHLEPIRPEVVTETPLEDAEAWLNE